jgi:flagellar biosynthesis regulator FlaF
MGNLTFIDTRHEVNFLNYYDCVKFNLEHLANYKLENPHNLSPHEIRRNLYGLEIDLLRALENVRKLKPLALDL